jgi:hypothetical protein
VADATDFVGLNYLRFVFSHSWFATVQDVLQADWHEVWHSPQPLPVVFFKVGFAIVLMFFIYVILLISRLSGIIQFQIP